MPLSPAGHHPEAVCPRVSEGAAGGGAAQCYSAATWE